MSNIGSIVPPWLRSDWGRSQDPDEDGIGHSDGPFHGEVAFYEAARRRVRYVEFCLGAEWGAMWISAILGMAEAIRDRYRCTDHDECRELRSMGEACFAMHRDR